MVQEIQGHGFPNDNAQDFLLVFVGWEWVIFGQLLGMCLSGEMVKEKERGKKLTGDDVLLRPQQIANSSLFDIRIFLFELIAKSEGNDGKSRVVTRARIISFVWVVHSTFAIVHVFPGFAVNIRDAFIPACSFQCTTE